MLFEGLFRIDVDLNAIPAQVQTYEISDDRLIYTFHLKDHSWSDGSKVSASDFTETFLELLDPEFPTPHSSLLYDVLNAEEAKKGLVPLSSVGIKALDDSTLQIQLKKPTPAFLQILAAPSLCPVHRCQDKENPNWAVLGTQQLISNGHYSLEKWVPHSEIILKKNASYSGNFPAKIPRVHISLIANEMSALHMYGNGYLDILGSPLSHIPLPYLKGLKSQLTIQPVSASLYIGFNTMAGPFQNVHFRKALSLAINRSEIIEHITQLKEEPALSPIPSILKGKSLSLIQDCDLKQAQIELAKAYELLSDEDKSKRLTLYFWPIELNYLIAQALQQQWKETLGIDIEIQSIDFKSLLSKVADASYCMAIFAWSADYGDPASLLHRFCNKDDSMNYPRWSHPSFIKALEEASFERDFEKRSAILQKAEGLLIDEMPIAPLFHWNFSLLINPELKGFAMDPLGRIHFENLHF